MPKELEASEMLGRTFRTEFTVTGLGASPVPYDQEHDWRPVRLRTSSGDRFELTLGELRSMLLSGFFQES